MYKGHPEAVVITCFFNSQNSPYRLMAFNEFYESIKHLNYAIVECVIGDMQPQLPENENIERVYTESLLWHKEALLNNIVSKLPKRYKYIFWVDADVVFTNDDWLVDGVDQLQSCDILQPFEYCVHLGKDELRPSFNVDAHRSTVSVPSLRHKMMWRSFCSNHVITNLSGDENYDRHGHVGFAWGAKREVLERQPLYDKALIGGADHIIAHAAAGQIPHSCISKSFTDNLEEVLDWSRKFYDAVGGRIGYVKGDLYHIWHGDIDKREYLKRIQEFTKQTKEITYKDKNGLYVYKDDGYMGSYFSRREVGGDGDFLSSMILGYTTDSTMFGGLIGGDFMGAMIGDVLNDSEGRKDPADTFLGADKNENFS